MIPPSYIEVRICLVKKGLDSNSKTAKDYESKLG